MNLWCKCVFGIGQRHKNDDKGRNVAKPAEYFLTPDFAGFVLPFYREIRAIGYLLWLNLMSYYKVDYSLHAGDSTRGVPPRSE